MSIPKINEIYRHFKGNLYQVLNMAQHSETGELLVIYQALYGEEKVYARPLEMFMEKVDREKYPDCTQEYRFELQEDINDTENNIDPKVLEFIDADSYEEKLNILVGIRHRVTTGMLTTMAIVCDVNLPDGDVVEQYEALKFALVTKERYECNRLR